MDTSFTNFKLSFGISDANNDIQYAQIMLGVLKELYSTFGIALLRDVETQVETLTLQHDIETQLIHKNIKSISVESYIENTDFTIDYENGTITSLSSGSIPDNTEVTITYDYYVFINESDELTLKIYPRATKLKYRIGVHPYVLSYVTLDGVTLTRDIDYYEYNNIFEIPILSSNLRIPYILNLNVGYDILPNDLKMAFYELINLRYERRKAKADLISRVEDGEGTQTTYRESSIPRHLYNIFCSYTGRSFAS